MKFKEKYITNPDLAHLFDISQEDSIEINAQNISARFLSEIDKLCEERGLLKKDLAQHLNTSRSYITQLFRGDKLLNLLFISKIEDYFKITFEIKSRSIADDLRADEIDKFNKLQISSINTKKYAWLLMTQCDHQQNKQRTIVKSLNKGVSITAA